MEAILSVGGRLMTSMFTSLTLHQHLLQERKLLGVNSKLLPSSILSFINNEDKS
jgi:hypothetical protein